ncbi:MAG: hypothetical protein ACOX45_06430 [Acutalibacteraceae bacterium]
MLICVLLIYDNFIVVNNAKGRVERLWETLQSRLQIEFAMRGIKTVEAVNAFLRDEYRAAFNARFGVNEFTISCFVPLPKSVLLDRLLAYKITRVLDSDGCFSWHGIRFRVEGKLANPELFSHSGTVEVILRCPHSA